MSSKTLKNNFWSDNIRHHGTFSSCCGAKFLSVKENVFYNPGIVLRTCRAWKQKETEHRVIKHVKTKNGNLTLDILKTWEQPDGF